MRTSFRAFLLFAFAAIAGAQQRTATITGTVYDPQAQRVGDATVTLVELRRSVATAADGTFRFDDVPARHYHVRAESPRLGFTVGEADVKAGETRTVEIVIDPLVHAEEIVVTASADSRRESEVYQPVNVLSDEELATRLQPTLGETLAQEPGVASSSFGAGASRPVIRGLGADRVRVLEEGIGTGDVSNVSPDHAVSVDPASATQIEIVRGPATLLYGSNAVGGVVNVISERIPSQTSAQLIGGQVDLRYASAAEEKSTGLTLNGGRDAFAWHADLTIRDTNDYEIPTVESTLANSALQSRSGTIGGSWVKDRGFIGAAITRFETNYGIPGDEAVRIDLQSQRLDLKGELTNLGFFNLVRGRLGITDYEHAEIEPSGEIGTQFTNDGFEGRLEAHHRPLGRVRGTWGAQITTTDFVAEGEEAFIPPNDSNAMAVFVFEELPGETFDLQFGARIEHQHVNVDTEELPDREFGGVSGSLGAIWRPIEGYAVAVSLARAVRLPTATELYSNGPHVATNQFEIGDPMLGEETSLGLDISLRRTVGRFRGELNLFNNSFDGYIYESPTGTIEDDMPVFLFVQRDARFRGAEIATHTHLFSRRDAHVELDLSADYVRATLEGGGNLPRIPPVRAAIGIRTHGGPWQLMAEVRHTFDQDDVAPLETQTAGYTLVNAHVGYRLIVRNTVHDILLRGMNLTDELARSHVSPLKERAPLPGRDISLAYKMTF